MVAIFNHLIRWEDRYQAKQTVRGKRCRTDPDSARSCPYREGESYRPLCLRAEKRGWVASLGMVITALVSRLTSRADWKHGVPGWRETGIDHARRSDFSPRSHSLKYHLNIVLSLSFNSVVWSMRWIPEVISMSRKTIIIELGPGNKIQLT